MKLIAAWLILALALGGFIAACGVGALIIIGAAVVGTALSWAIVVIMEGKT
jgi:hypothetical protein